MKGEGSVQRKPSWRVGPAGLPLPSPPARHRDGQPREAGELATGPLVPGALDSARRNSYGGMNHRFRDRLKGGGAMWRPWALISFLVLVAGCASDGQKHWYDEALKDARGDNQEMRGFGSSPRAGTD